MTSKEVKLPIDSVASRLGYLDNTQQVALFAHAPAFFINKWLSSTRSWAGMAERRALRQKCSLRK